MSDTYVPLISSGTAGPLGVLHLPRLWQKVSLEEAGKLAAGYPGIGRDQQQRGERCITAVVIRRNEFLPGHAA